MKKLISLLFFVSLNLFAQTKAPIQLLNPAGSTAGQVIVSTGATSAPAWGSPSTSEAQYIATLGISGSLNQGAFAYGTLSYSDINLLASYQCNANNYCQQILQNTNSGATATADYVVSNNLGTASTYYANFGINSSAFSGTGSFNLPNASYMTATSGDLAIGTTTANAIHFVVNNGATDAGGFSSAGIFSLAHALAVTSGGTGVTTSTGSGSVVLNTSPTLITPALGTPTSGIATNLTGTATALNIGGNAATATTATNLSGGTASATTISASSTITRTVPDNMSAAIPTIASATTIAPTTPVIFVSGTTAIATITAPTGCTNSCSITIIPTGVFATTTAGNISIVSTAVVSKALIMTYDATGSKWYPSY